MKHLYDELTRRFPEIPDIIFEGDEGAPYLLMNDLARWLSEIPEEAMTPEIITRVVALKEWCEEQPTGNDAENDIYTIFIVGFYEKLFRANSTRKILPKLVSRDDIVTNAGYLRTWVGADNYEEAVRQFKPGG